MEYDIYFHSDFDGVSSAALMLNFFRKTGNKVKRLMPVSHGAKKEWLAMKFIRPSAVVDFLFHPKTEYWFDHHPTTFHEKSWENSFKSDKKRKWDPKSKSACSLVFKHLHKVFSFNPPSYLRETVKWADIIDGALLKSAKQAIEAREPALKLDAFIDEYHRQAGTMRWCVAALEKGSLANIVKKPKLVSFLKKFEQRKIANLSFYRRHLEMIGKIAFLDAGRKKSLSQKFISFYLHPEAKYGLYLSKGSEFFHLSLSRNPWYKKKEKIIHIGQLLRKYGGGGHQKVGGLERKSYAEIKKAAEEIMKKVNDEG